MKKLLSLSISIIVFCSLSLAQTIPIHIKVLGNDGKPLLKAAVELYDDKSDKFTQIELSKDGSFSFESEKKYLTLKLSGVNHKGVILPVIINDAAKLEFKVLLGTNIYTDDFSKVKILGNFNKWRRDNAVSLQKNEKGIYYADIATEQDTIEYQLVGLSKMRETHCWNGTMSDGYKYDNAGDFRSVIYKKGKTAHIEFDPAKLIAQSPEAKLIAEDETIPEIIIMKEKLSYGNILERMQRESEIDPNKKFDISKETDEFRNKMYSEKNEFLKGFYAITYLKYWSYIEKSKFDTVICQKALELVPPESILWMINPNLMVIASRGFRYNRDVYMKYIKEVTEKQQNVDVKAEALRNLIYDANFRKDTVLLNSYIDKIVKECPNSNITKNIKAEFLTLALGKNVPDFEVKSLADGNIIYSNKSLLGKFYLIDFWASWCGPCIGELPNLHEAYKEFKDKNFEILSISLDAKRQDVEKFRKEKFEMPWLHSFLDKGFGSDLTQKFGVVGIPRVVLVSDKGKILAIDGDLRGENLKLALQKYLGGISTSKSN